MSAVDGYSVEVSDGYEAASAAWELGPERVYEALDRALLDLADDDLAGRRVLDLGSGGGAVSRLVATRGGRPVALDGALGMCRMTARRGVPTVRGDATRLCFRPESFDAVVAAFVLNHVPDPLATLGDVRRAVAPGGFLLASTFAAGPDHPVKAAVDAAAAGLGWRQPAWYTWVKTEVVGRVADPVTVGTMARDAGFTGVDVTVRHVDVGPLDPEALVHYRLGMANLAGFVRRLPETARRTLIEDAVSRLGPSPPPLRPAVLMLRASMPIGGRRRG